MGVKQSKRSVDITTAVEDGDHTTAGVIHMHEDGAKAALNGNAAAPTTPAKDAAANEDSAIVAKKKVAAADGVHQENGTDCDGVGVEGANHVANGEAEADDSGAAAKEEAEGADSGKKKKKEKKVKKKWSLRSISFSRKDRTKPQQQVQSPDAANVDNVGEEATQKDAAETVVEGEQKEPEKADGVAASVPAQQVDHKGEPKAEVVEEKLMNGASSEVKEEQKGGAELQQAEVATSVEAATPSTAVASPADREDGDEVPPPLPTTPPPTEPTVEEAASTGVEVDAERVPADTSTVACATAVVETVEPSCSKEVEGSNEAPVAHVEALVEPTVHTEAEAPVIKDPEAVPPIANQPPEAAKDCEEQKVVEAPRVEESLEGMPKESAKEAPKEVAEEAQKEVMEEVQEEVVEEAQKEMAAEEQEEVAELGAPEQEEGLVKAGAEEEEQSDALVVPPSVNILPPSPAPQPEELAAETQEIESSEPVMDGSPETSEVVVSKVEECSKVTEENKTELTQEIQGEE